MEPQPSDLLQVIWLLARSQVTPSERARAATLLSALVEQGRSPASLVSGLASHGLVPLTYRHLVGSGDVEIPQALKAEIAGEFRRHVLTRFRYARRLRELLTALDAAGIPALPYKGPALATQLFGNFAMRQYGDLDILVRPADAARATETLVAEGLTPQHAAEGWDDYLRSVRHSSELRDPRERVTIELHWSVADRFLGMDLDVDWLLDQPDQIEFLGRATNVMVGERLLMALCLHGTKHIWMRGVWLAEVAEIVRQSPGLDWAALFARADRMGFGRSFRVSLILARDLLGCALPSPWDRRLDHDSGAKALAAVIAGRLASGAADDMKDRFRLGYLAQTSTFRRMRFSWHVATDLSERDLRGNAGSVRSTVALKIRRALRLATRLRASR